MKNKRILILLGVTLIAVIILLVVYAYSLSKNSYTQPSPVSSAPRQLASAPKPINDSKEIKTEIATLDKKLEASDCSEEDATAYKEKIKAGAIKTAQGTIIEVKSSSLKIDFTLGSNSWVSEVIVDKDTTIQIPASTNNSDSKILAFSNLKAGDTVLVNFLGDITNNTSFTAFSVFKMN